MEAGKKVKEEGGENDLIERIKADDAFLPIRDRIDEIMAPENFTGMSALQVDNFLRDVVAPILKENNALLGQKGDVRV